jgi:uncharacterized membrane protein (UPF0182 family)
VATRPPIGLPKLSRRSRILLIIAATVILLLLVGARLLDTYVDWLWFGEVGYRSVFSTVLLTRIGLFFGVGLLVGGMLALSLIMAYRTRPVFVPVSGADDPLAKYRSTVMQRVRLFGIGIPLIVGLIAGSTAQTDWQQFQLLVNGTSFGITDPEFGKDIGFYAFTLPFISWLITWLFVSIAIAFFGALITHYLFGGVRLVGRGGQFSVPARMQLSITAGLFVVVYAVDYFFERYELLFSDRNELFTGATYTDLNAVLPAKLILMFIAGFCAVAFFVGAFLRNLQLPAIATALLVLTSILIGAAWPAVLEQFSVRPNANEKEAKSIERNIEATRLAFGLTEEKVKFSDYSGAANASGSEVRNNPSNVATLENLRLLDPSILSPTFTQREGRENFYGFPEKLDIDRYTVDGKTQDYIVAAREIRTELLAENQRNWINQHMVFTHGNGFVAAPANTVHALQEQSGQGGYPIFSVSDLTNRGKIRVDQPRVYYGELSTNYAIVGGQTGEAPGEYDTPTDRSFIYDGKGGVQVSGWLNRLVFAAHYGERNILFSSAIGDGSKIMYNRAPRERVIKAAPWLTVDGDPYPAVIDGRIQWIVDGYTTLDSYPYAQRVALGEATTDTLSGVARQENRLISYIRNSVKATVDAYDGTVTLYSIDDTDPVLRTWQNVFPGTVKPSSEIPEVLKAHFRYPEDLFKVQRELLKRYHVSNPQEFFSTQTFWDTPQDPTKDANAGKLPPYYVYAQAPGQDRPTFQITSALTLLEREFLAAWVSVSSDPHDYGTIRVLKLPTTGSEQATDQLAEGPVQVQNRFQTTPKVTEQQTLFRNTSVTVTFGNLLTLPIAGGLLYVEPMYIQRNDANSFPQLARVLVAYGDRVGFEPTIQAALDAVFGAGTGDVATPTAPDGQPTTPPSSPSSPTSPTSPANPPPAAGGGTGSAELDEAVRAMDAALSRAQTALTSGNLEEYGKALAEFQAASKRYQTARTGQGATPPPSSPPSSPSTTPTPGNGGG